MDFMDGGDDNDKLYGRGDNDELHGGNGDDKLYGELGNDDLYGGENFDQLYGGDGYDDLYGGGGNDYLYGEAGNDDLRGGRGNDLVAGGADYDTYYVADEDVGSTFFHHSSLDLVARTSKIYLTSGTGLIVVDTDTFNGTSIEEFQGVDKTDFMSGDSNANTFYGNGGNDTLSGKGGTDSLYGGAGNDVIEGGTGDDDLYGGSSSAGSGNDTFVFDDNYGNDWVYHFTNGDILDVRKLGITGMGQVLISDHANGTLVTFVAGLGTTIFLKGYYGDLMAAHFDFA